jgi:hypothetical protein
MFKKVISFFTDSYTKAHNFVVENCSLLASMILQSMVNGSLEFTKFIVYIISLLQKLNTWISENITIEKLK